MPDPALLLLCSSLADFEAAVLLLSRQNTLSRGVWLHARVPALLAHPV